MLRSSKKLIAVFMLLWLPLFNGSALAATVSMQMKQGGCQKAVASPAMFHQSMSEQLQHSGNAYATAEHGQPGGVCGVCHLACTGYLLAPCAEMAAMKVASFENTPYLVAFHSVASAPLVPPPLVRA